MAGARITAKLDGYDEVIASLEELLRRGEDLSPALDALGAAMVSSTVSRFEDQRAPDGSPWTPSLRALEEGGQTLTDTARLQQSVTYEFGKTWVSWGTNVIYAAIHNFGGEIRAKGGKLKFSLPGGGFAAVDKVTMPQREFLGVNADDEAEALGIFGDYLEAVNGVTA